MNYSSVRVCVFKIVKALAQVLCFYANISYNYKPVTNTFNYMYNVITFII